MPRQTRFLLVTATAPDARRRSRPASALRTFLAVPLLSLSLQALALPQRPPTDPTAPSISSPDTPKKKPHAAGLCWSTAEYIETLQFLRQKITKISEPDARLIADTVSQGCDGAAKRFVKTFRLLRKLGVVYQKALQLALEFSKYDESVQKNFFEVLQQAYLKDIFDFNFNMALDVAFDFSKNLPSHHQQARQDFIQLAQMCVKSSQLGLPVKTCAQMAIAIARLSPYYEGGIFTPFQDLFSELRRKEHFNLPIKEALRIASETLKHGPTAPHNFVTAYKFARSEEGLSLAAPEALSFAQVMAQRSSQVNPPPLAPEPPQPKDKDAADTDN